MKAATAILSEAEKIRSITMSNEEFIQWQQCLSLYKDTICRESIKYINSPTT
jgi:hypothetical protein